MIIASTWYPASCFSLLGFPADIRPWFLSPQSTTQLFNTINPHPMEVKGLRQHWQVPLREEAVRLGLQLHRKIFIREVELFCEGEQWMSARAAIPSDTLVGKYHGLKKLGTRSLGEVLFRDPLTQRSAFEIAKYSLPHRKGEYFARRSIFLLDNKPLLLTEIFLPHCVQILTEYYANAK